MQSSEFMQMDSIKPSHKICKETIMTIKHEIENPRRDDNFISYGSPTLTNICLKNQRRQFWICDYIMEQVDNIKM